MAVGDYKDELVGEKLKIIQNPKHKDDSTKGFNVTII